MTKKELVYQGLDQYKFLIEDTSLDSPNYFRLKDIPTLLSGGKNLIKIRLNPNFLKINSEIRFEVLDYNGNPIYNEFTSIVDDDGEAHVIAIYIYSDTPPGPANLYLVGQASNMPNGASVPKEYSDSFNVGWKHQVLVAPDKRNSTEILFNASPSASITEVIRPYLIRTFPTGQEDVTFTQGQVSYQLLNQVPTLQLQGAAFSASMINGTLTVNNPTNPQPTPTQGTIIDQTYKTKIKKILTPNSALLESAYKVPLNFSPIKRHTYNQFDFSNYSLAYKDDPAYIATQNSMSYAHITLHDIDPATGDIYRIKTFRRSPGVVSTWQLVDDTILDSSEMLLDTGSININKRIGVISDQTVVNNYWNLDDSDNTIASNTNIYQNSSSLNNSIKVDIGVNSGIPDRETVRLFTTSSFEFFKTGEYTLQFDALAQLTGSDSKVNIFLSGSAFKYDGTEKIKGKKIGFLNPTTTVRYDDYKIDFDADSDGYGTLIFEIEKGTWFYSDISIKSSQVTGFGPNSTTITLPVETQMLGDKLDFKFEYFDYQNNQAKTVTYIDDKVFVGGNTYIDGANNLMTGSLYIGKKFGEGLEQSGRSSGMIRSTKYLGFNSASTGTGPSGWMMWSGSALQDINPSYYNGVGLELHGGKDPGLNNGKYTASGVLQFRSDTRQLFVKGTIRTRFDDGRTMNPPIPWPERFVLDDTENTFKFYLTGSTKFDPVSEIGTGILAYQGNSGTTTVYHTGLVVTQPLSSSAFRINSPINPSTSDQFAGVIVKDSVPSPGVSAGGLYRSTMIVPGQSEILTYNLTSSYAGNQGHNNMRRFIKVLPVSVKKKMARRYYTDERKIMVVNTDDWHYGAERITGASIEVGGYPSHSLSGDWNEQQASGWVRGFDSHVGIPIESYGQRPTNISDHPAGAIKYACYYAKIGGAAQTGNITNPTGSLAAATYSFYGQSGEMVNKATYNKAVAGRTMEVSTTGLFGNSTSDERLKSNIITIDKSLNKIRALRGVYFNWKDTGSMTDRREIGMIAQEVEKVVPELVFPPDNHASHYSINYKQMAGLFVEAIKEQQSTIESLTNRIAALESGSIG